ncbi:MAG: hypothetical protein JWQ38_1488 [Flavipsychrobacter sp.]|nr:hypothetical protein [Flavipsychrobacter sp.]
MLPALCLACIPVYAQNSADAIKHKIAAYHKTDSGLVQLHLDLARAYLNVQSDSSLKYSAIAKDLAEKVKDRRLLLASLNLYGQCLADKGDLPRSLQIFQQAEKLTSTDKERAEIIRNQGNITIEMGKGDEAIVLYKKALKYAELANDKFGMATTTSNISYVYRQQGKYEDAAAWQIKAIKIAEELNNPTVLAGCNIQLALLQYSRKLYDDAAMYAADALKNYQKLNNLGGIATANSLLGGCHSEKGEYYKAVQNFMVSYNTNLSLGDVKRISASASDLAELNIDNKHYDTALKYIDIALDNIKKTTIAYTTIKVYITRAKIYTALNRLTEAQADIDQALALSKKGGYKDLERKAMEVLALVHSAKGDHASAFETQLKSNALHDSILNETNSKQINQLRTQYETEKKEQQILILNTTNSIQQLNLNKQELEIEKRGLSIENQQLELNNKNLLIGKKESEIKEKAAEAQQQKQRIIQLNQQAALQQLEIRQRNIYLAAAVLLILAVAGIGYLIYSRRKAEAQVTLQQEINRQQEITAREILNAEERERRRMGSDLHDGVGQLLSSALLTINRLAAEAAGDEQKRLTGQALTLVTEGYDEIRSISHQIIPNALLKYGLSAAIRDFLSKIDERTIKVSLSITGISDRLEEQTETILYRVIQETTANVIKHAQASTLSIQLTKDTDGIDLTIEDNGKGFDVKQLEKAEGIGMRNIYSRVSFLKGTVDLQSSPGKGTLVAIFIPHG